MIKITLTDVRNWKKEAMNVDGLSQARKSHLNSVLHILASSDFEAYVDGKSERTVKECREAKEAVTIAFNEELELRKPLLVAEGEKPQPIKEEVKAKKPVKKPVAKKPVKKAAKSKAKAKVENGVKIGNQFTFEEKKRNKMCTVTFEIVRVSEDGLALMQNIDRFVDCFVVSIKQKGAFYQLTALENNWQVVAEKV